MNQSEIRYDSFRFSWSGGKYDWNNVRNLRLTGIATDLGDNLNFPLILCIFCMKLFK